jgi:hypothetical protein
MHNMKKMTAFTICKIICKIICWQICRIRTVCHWFNMQNMSKICIILCTICKTVCIICNTMSPNPICRICQKICSICQTICPICSLEQIHYLMWPIRKICKIICTIRTICNHDFNMSNMHSPLCWCRFWTTDHGDCHVCEESLEEAAVLTCKRRVTSLYLVQQACSTRYWVAK